MASSRHGSRAGQQALRSRSRGVITSTEVCNPNASTAAANASARARGHPGVCSGICWTYFPATHVFRHNGHLPSLMPSRP